MAPKHGLSSPVIVADSVDWNRDYSDTQLADLLAMTDEQLAAVDPLAANLVVAKGIPALADLSIHHYQKLVNSWVQDFTNRCLPEWEPYFYKSPGDYRNDIQYFRLGMVCQYLE